MKVKFFSIGYIPEDTMEPEPPLRLWGLGDPYAAKTPSPRDCVIWRTMFVFGAVAGFLVRGYLFGRRA
jgi:hypothetical protein